MAVSGGIASPVLRQIARAKDELCKIGSPDVPLMRKIGAIIAKECRKAFPNQALGEIRWPERYPGMEEPFINIAGALEDWNAGRPKPQVNRFQDRPALVGPGGGHLGRSIEYKLGASTPEAGAEILVGTNKEYALVHQEGGDTEIPVTQSAKRAILEWLYGGKKKTLHYGRQGKGDKTRTENVAYEKHVAPLLYKSVHRQSVIARPFVGMTPQAEDEVGKVIRDHFKKIAN